MTTLSLAPAVRGQQLQVMTMHWAGPGSSQGTDADQGLQSEQLRAVRGPASHPLAPGEAANVAVSRTFGCQLDVDVSNYSHKQVAGNAAGQRGATTPGRSATRRQLQGGCTSSTPTLQLIKLDLIYLALRLRQRRLTAQAM
jgi:hypothetical protein